MNLDELFEAFDLIEPTGDEPTWDGEGPVWAVWTEDGKLEFWVE